jgi:hypothetical protein
MPSGGSLSGTALVVSSGARTRWANIFVGILIAIIMVLFSQVVELIAMPALAGLLIVIGFQTIKPTDILTVWQTGAIPREDMLITFVSMLVMPLQFAVVSEGVLTQLERTGLLELIGKESIFIATEEFGMAANQAFEYAQKWLEAAEQQETPAENES